MAFIRYLFFSSKKQEEDLKQKKIVIDISGVEFTIVLSK